MRKADALLATRLLRMSSTLLIIVVDVWGVYPFVLATAIQNGASPDQANWAAVIIFISVLAAWLGKLVFMLKISK